MRNGNQPTLDRTNMRILERLRTEGRAAYSALAEELNCSVNTVRDRIMAMERRGVIRGYRAVVCADAAGHHLRALVLVAQDPYHGGEAGKIDTGLVPGCVGAHRTTGCHAVSFEITAPDHATLHRVIHDHIYPQGYMQAKIIPLGARQTRIGEANKTPQPQAMAIGEQTPTAQAVETTAEVAA